MNGIDIFCFASPYNRKNIFHFLILSFPFFLSSFYFIFFTFLRPSFALRLSRNIFAVPIPAFVFPFALFLLLSFRFKFVQLLIKSIRVSATLRQKQGRAQKAKTARPVVTACAAYLLHKKDGGGGRLRFCIFDLESLFVFILLQWKPPPVFLEYRTCFTATILPYVYSHF